MYIEIVIIGVIVLIILIINGQVSTNKFLSDYDGLFAKLKEPDYDFLCRAKYGDRVNPDILFSKRIKNGLLAILVAFICFTLTTSWDFIIQIASSIGVGFLLFKSGYTDLKGFYRKHLFTIDMLLPYYLKNLEILIQHYTVPVAIGKSIDSAPEIFKDGLRRMINAINSGDSTIDPYMSFAKEFPVRDSMRMMRLLYRLSLGRQERKQEQLLMFSKTISNLQQKARETKYKNRLEKMEGKTRSMLVVTGAGVMILLVISMMGKFNI